MFILVKLCLKVGDILCLFGNGKCFRMKVLLLSDWLWEIGNVKIWFEFLLFNLLGYLYWFFVVILGI